MFIFILYFCHVHKVAVETGLNVFSVVIVVIFIQFEWIFYWHKNSVQSIHSISYKESRRKSSKVEIIMIFYLNHRFLDFDFQNAYNFPIVTTTETKTATISYPGFGGVLIPYYALHTHSKTLQIARYFTHLN